MTKKQLWEIYDNLPTPGSYWEHHDDTKEWNKGSGLLLAICAKCGNKQTRETYLSTSPKRFWAEWITLIQDYQIIGVAKCAKCGQWHQVYG